MLEGNAKGMIDEIRETHKKEVFLINIYFYI